MNTIEQALSAGQTVNFPCGRFFLLLEADEDVTITFFGINKTPIGQVEDIRAGFVANFAEGQQPISLSIYSATAQTVKFQSSDIAGIEYLAFSGNISELGLLKRDHSNYEQSKLSDCFWGVIAGQSAIGSWYGCGMRNPAASGIRVMIDKFWYSIQTATPTMSNWIEVNSATFTSLSHSHYGHNKNVDGAVSVASLVSGAYSVPTIIPPAKAVHISEFNKASHQDEFKNALILNEGDYISLGCYAGTGVHFHLGLEWREESL